MTPNSIQCFQQRMYDLSEEARKFGINVLYILHEYDPLSDTETVTARSTTGPTLSIGMLESAKVEYQREIRDSIDRADD